MSKTDRDDVRGITSSKGLTRRSLIVRAGGTLAAVSGAGSILAACGGGSSETTTSASAPAAGQAKGIGGIPIASKRHPVKLPLYPDNHAIASSLDPESGPLVVLDWGDYISPGVLKSFEAKYGVKTKLTTYSSFQESMSKVVSGAVKPDVWVPVTENLPQLVAAKLIQPINHDYIPNLEHAIPAMANPYYDQGSQYTVPNYIWTSGIMWRADLLPDVDPASMANPWAVFWETPAAKGKIGLQNATYFEGLALAFLHLGVTDFTTITKAQVDEAVVALKKLTANGAKFQYTAFQPIAEGTEILAHAWPGDAFVAPAYLPKGKPADVIRYWFPPDGKGLVNNDFWCIPKSSENPVLGHLFMNHLLETETALENFKTVGYQQPLKELTLDVLKERKVGPPELLDSIFVTEEIATNGLPTPTPTREQLKWYEAAFATVSAGAS